MARKPPHIMKAELNAVRRLFDDTDHKWTDAEIMQKLTLTHSRFYRYKARIKLEDSEAWERQAQEDKDKWQRLRTGPLEKRALEILEAMDRGHKVCEDIINGEDTPEAVKLEAAKWAVKFKVNAYYLLEHGPQPSNRFSPRVINGNLKAVEKLEIRRSI